MIGNFDRALAFTLAPTQDGQPLHCTAGDPGGATDEGITLPTLATFLGRRCTLGDLVAIAGDPVRRAAFYRTQYWNVVDGDGLPLGIDLMVFDFGVTDGPNTSARVFQQAIGLTGADADGWIGPQTLAAAAQYPIEKLIARTAAWQLSRIATLDPRFQNGWRNRVSRAVATAQSWNAPPISDTTPADQSADALNAQELADIAEIPKT